MAYCLRVCSRCVMPYVSSSNQADPMSRRSCFPPNSLSRLDSAKLHTCSSHEIRRKKVHNICLFLDYKHSFADPFCSQYIPPACDGEITGGVKMGSLVFRFQPERGFTTPVGIFQTLFRHGVLRKKDLFSTCKRLRDGGRLGIRACRAHLMLDQPYGHISHYGRRVFPSRRTIPDTKNCHFRSCVSPT